MAAMPATAKLSGSPLNPMVVVYGLNLNMTGFVQGGWSMEPERGFGIGMKRQFTVRMRTLL
jgi:hypothetical protein